MEKIIDIHSHMFNLKYLPVAGIIRRYSNNKIPHKIATGIEWLLLKGIDESISIKHQKMIENIDLIKFNVPVKKVEINNYLIEEIIDYDPDDTVNAMVSLADNTDLLIGELSDAIDEFEKRYSDVLNINRSINLDSISNMNSEEMVESIEIRAQSLKRMLSWIVEKFKELANYMKWFLFMRNSEEDIYNHISVIDENGVEKYVFLMMDVDHFFNEEDSLKYKSRYDYENDQISKMQHLISNHDSLIGFVAFNPERNNYMEIIEDAIDFKGFKGVKFYPPMGYNAGCDEKYEKQIDTLLEYCSKNKIPLFTHCNNKGFEAYPKNNSGYMSNPKYWEKALEKYNDLILCLGHGGGSEGWFCKNSDRDKIKAAEISSYTTKDSSIEQSENWNNSYAALVFKLCVEYDNVYCDTSYLDDMINSDGSFEEELKENFNKRLLKLFNSEPRFRKKIMYGSDWHMLFKEGKNKVYLNLYKDFFNDTDLKIYKEDFFYNNAIDYLRLNEILI